MSISLQTPVGPLCVRADEERVLNVVFGAPAGALDTVPTALEYRLLDALRGYFADFSWPCDFPLAPTGTVFQQRVWRALCAIPMGETRTYGELARQLQTGARAVGGACRANPIVLLIPCHRVVAAPGVGGFAGHCDGPLPKIKQWLLAHEQQACGSH